MEWCAAWNAREDEAWQATPQISSNAEEEM